MNEAESADKVCARLNSEVCNIVCTFFFDTSIYLIKVDFALEWESTLFDKSFILYKFLNTSAESCNVSF